MQKAKKSGFLILGFIIVIFVIIAIIFILKDKAKDLTLSMYKQISNSQKFTLTMEEKGEDYNYKVSIARSDTDISIDTNTEFSDEKQHNTTLITDGYIYYITHDEQEYMALDIQDVEIDSVIPEIKDVDGKEYQKGKEEIKGKTYYYEEYEGIDTFLLLTDVSDEGKIKTRFYFDNGKISYIKNIIEYEEGEGSEELLSVTCNYDADDSLFEIPEEYAENDFEDEG